jgi:hypothetical protein
VFVGVLLALGYFEGLEHFLHLVQGVAQGLEHFVDLFDGGLDGGRRRRDARAIGRWGCVGPALWGLPPPHRFPLAGGSVFVLRIAAAVAADFGFAAPVNLPVPVGFGFLGKLGLEVPLPLAGRLRILLWPPACAGFHLFRRPPLLLVGQGIFLDLGFVRLLLFPNVRPVEPAFEFVLGAQRGGGWPGGSRAAPAATAPAATGTPASPRSLGGPGLVKVLHSGVRSCFGSHLDLKLPSLAANAKGIYWTWGTPLTSIGRS